MSDDFDRKLEQVRRGTEPLRAPEDFDAVMTAKLVAAAALPPAVAGAGLALSVRLLLGVLGFSVAAGGVWWATQGVGGTAEPHVDAPSPVTQGVVPGGPNTPVDQPAPPSREPPSRGVVVASANGASIDSGIVEPVSGGGAVSATEVSGTDASTAPTGAIVAVTQAVPVLVPSGKVMSCGRSVDRIDLISRGPPTQLQETRGSPDRFQTFETALAEARASRAETVALGHFVVDGGPGVKAVAGNVRSVLGDWFIVSGRARTRVEVVVNEYRPVVLSLEQLRPGEFYVGDVQLNWVGAHSADEHGLKVLVQAAPPAEPARVRLFPMACGAFGEWKPSFEPAIDVAAGAADTDFQHLSPTRYRIAAYDPGAAPAWADQTVYDVRESSAVLALAHDESVNVEYATHFKEMARHPPVVRARLELSRGWRPGSGLEVRFVPGRQREERCFELPEGWVVHDLGDAGIQGPWPLDAWERAPLVSCLPFDHTLLFESLLTRVSVAARFSR